MFSMLDFFFFLKVAVNMAHLSHCKGGSWKIQCFAHVLLFELGIFLV